MEERKDIYILAIESSCDETAAAVVKNGREVLSNVISSQIDLHTLYGGVVPEIASRKHVENIDGVIKKALTDADMKLEEMDAIGVTYGPGLVGALLVGLAEAKALAYAADKPLIGVHHIEGHICANYIQNKDFEPPYMALVVSGGHSHLVSVSDYGKYEILGRTRDDAAGEAYDKVARAIGMGYPGGPKIDAAAKLGNPDAVKFPRVFLEEDSYDFSFSGLKSAVLNYVNKQKMMGEEIVP
ncbi:tRNA (adenosine(37)-N6)-threonylcarbamoyltransferase complex transferase subunit TsaD, partial [Anaerotignum sp.]